MAKTHFASDGLRVGDVKQCSAAPTPAGNYVKGGPATRRFMDVKSIEMTPFKGVARENKSCTGPTHA